MGQKVLRELKKRLSAAKRVADAAGPRSTGSVKWLSRRPPAADCCDRRRARFRLRC